MSTHSNCNWNCYKQELIAYRKLYQTSNIGLVASQGQAVAGDFNAHNNVWGYATIDRKGINLAECADTLGMKLITDSRFPTRRCNTAQRDTTPELTFLGNAEGSWDNLQ